MSYMSRYRSRFWRPAKQYQAADARSLGELVLPRPGSPEPINGLGGLGQDGQYIRATAMGCGDCPPGSKCGGPCGCGPMSGITDTITGLSTPMKIAGVVALYFLYKKMKRR